MSASVMQGAHNKIKTCFSFIISYSIITENRLHPSTQSLVATWLTLEILLITAIKLFYRVSLKML